MHAQLLTRLYTRIVHSTNGPKAWKEYFTKLCFYRILIGNDNPPKLQVCTSQYRCVVMVFAKISPSVSHIMPSSISKISMFSTFLISEISPGSIAATSFLRKCIDWLCKYGNPLEDTGPQWHPCGIPRWSVLDTQAGFDILFSKHYITLHAPMIGTVNPLLPASTLRILKSNNWQKYIINDCLFMMMTG